MRTLFVGDVHGCADEFASILEAASADRVILLGDLFTKGPDPVGVWRLEQQHSCEAVLGNHDHYLLRKPGSLERLGLPPHNTELPFGEEAVSFWNQVDLYIGGVEHAVLHLLYARFWHKVLYDCGLVPTKEPFQLSDQLTDLSLVEVQLSSSWE